ncbi:hypothetical protein VP01_1654g3 [Puccinia sorghi]|uniref:Uncharacterized protein n=1 Tax=Puccinia sorghi TaxID=27349 RepID=A0A0L6VGI0_9BASI|nr:hypothetical protein VP01_1654g3 [Puccinia sorghi]
MDRWSDPGGENCEFFSRCPWLTEELRKSLSQDPIGPGKPLSMEAQVTVGLYRLGHGISFVTITLERWPHIYKSKFPLQYSESTN